MNETKVNVLWVDDQIFDNKGEKTDMCRSFINKAYDMGVDIEPFATYDEAYSSLVENPMKWTCIVLDVRNDNATEGNENDGYNVMRKKIEEFRNKRNSVEPFIFVFSGNRETIGDSQRYFMKDAGQFQSKSVYDKSCDSSLLIEDIKKVAKQSVVCQMNNDYHDVFESMNKLGWDSMSQLRVYELILGIEYKDEKTNDKLFVIFRKLLESCIYTKIKEVGLMNSYSVDVANDTINMKSNFVGKSPQIPVYIQRAFHSLTVISNNGAHEEDKPNLVVSKDVSQGKAPYLLKSCLYDLLTIINWEAQL